MLDTTRRKLLKFRKTPRRFLRDMLEKRSPAQLRLKNSRFASVSRAQVKELDRLRSEKRKISSTRKSKGKEQALREEASRQRFLRAFGADACAKRPFYNFGAGNWKHPFFQNMDISDPNYPDNQPDVVYDAFDSLPFSITSDSAELFYFSHVNEHLTDSCNDFILAEVFRCLRPGGVLRIVYPDLDRAHDAYVSGDREFFLERYAKNNPKSRRTRETQKLAQLLLDFFATRAQIGSPNDGNRKYEADEFASMIDEMGYEKACSEVANGMLVDVQRRRPNTHINWWNHEKFYGVLAVIGFVHIKKSGYMQSGVAALRDENYFDVVCPHMSGYVECRKPEG